MGDDWSQYVSHTQNLAAGEAYAPTPCFSNLHSHVAPATCPPVYPLLLAPAYRLFGFNLLALKGVTVLCFCLGLGFAFMCFWRGLSAQGSLLSMLATGFNPSPWRFKESLLSDIPFLCACPANVAEKPRIVGLVPQLQTCAHPRLTDEGAYAEDFDICGVDYLLEIHLKESKNPEHQALPPSTARALAGRLRPVLQNGWFSL